MATAKPKPAARATSAAVNSAASLMTPPTQPAPRQVAAPRPVAPVAAPAPAPVQGPVAPVPGSVASITARDPFSLTRTADDLAADQARARVLAVNQADADMSVNPEQEYRQKLKMYQAQIDATNAVYNDQLNASRVAGQGRLGSSRAMQGRSGVLGSDFGAAQTDTITAANQEADQAIQDERSTAIATILGLARKDALDAVTAKTAAKKAGADALLKYYSEDVPAQRTGRISKVAKALFDKKLDPSTLNPTELKQLTADWNVSADDISSAYNDLKTTSDAAAAKTDLEAKKSQADIDKINSEIANAGFFNLSEGQARYDSKGNVIASKAKTYAPKEGGGSAVTPLGGTSPFVAQSNYANLTANQKKQADSLNNLVRSLGEYKTYYDANPGSFGGALGNMFGADSGMLETKLNSIIFAAAQAEGTGALQAADRAVIEKIVPNPTSLGGAYNTATKGGKAANVKRIEDQIKKYTDNLAGLGLAPVLSEAAGAASSPSNPTVLTSPDGTQEVDVASLTPAELQETRDAGWQ